MPAEAHLGAELFTRFRTSYEEEVITSGTVPVVLSIWARYPKAPTIVFLPGTMTHPLFYGDFLNRLNKAGFNVVGVHYQAHGKSPRVSAPLTFDSLVTNAKDAVTYARDRFGSNIVALGSSQGAIIAMALAATDRRLTAVFAHNILDPSMPASLRVTRFPSWLAPAYRWIVGAMRLSARVFPRIQIPLGFYLDLNRICLTPKTRNRFLTDPIGLRSYPLGFLASLFSADLSGMSDGSIQCPVVVISATGDPLFPFDYTRDVYESIVAPSKEMIAFDLDCHLIFNECTSAVTPAVVERLMQVTGYNAAPLRPTRERGR